MERPGSKENIEHELRQFLLVVEGSSDRRGRRPVTGLPTPPDVGEDSRHWFRWSSRAASAGSTRVGPSLLSTLWYSPWPEVLLSCEEDLFRRRVGANSRGITWRCSLRGP